MANTATATFRNVRGPWAQASKQATASLTTALTGTNNDLTYTADASGAGANAITVRYVVAGTSTALSVSVTGNAITVNVATNGGGTATSTAAQVKTALDASTPAAALINVANAAGNDGTGVVTAMSATALTGGVTRSTAIGSSGWGRAPVSRAGRGSLSTA